ncbi:MAG: hypothetical protein ACJ72S_12760, partial [Nitrososphaeraceae archaeon]
MISSEESIQKIVLFFPVAASLEAYEMTASTLLFLCGLHPLLLALVLYLLSILHVSVLDVAILWLSSNVPFPTAV